MTWRERRQAASFKGVRFFVDSHQLAAGRRVSVRRFADRDGSVQQDMGAEPDQYDIECFLAGDNYDLERQTLETALRSEGPGTLSLPTRGDLWVRVTRGPFVSEARQRGGWCTIRFSCVEEERRSRSIRETNDTRRRLIIATDDVNAAAGRDFLSVFSVLGMPGKYVTTAVNAVSNVSTAMRRVMGMINGTLNPLQDLSAAVDGFGAAAADLVASPQLLQSRLTGVVTSVVGSANNVRDAVDRTTGLQRTVDDPYEQALSARTVFAISRETNGLGGSEPDGADTELADRNARNVRAVYRLARANAVAAQAAVLASVPMDSATRALEILEGMSGEIDALQEFSANDELFRSLLALRAALGEHLMETASKLPRAIRYQPKQAVPAILLAHTTYRDARLESEIVARNSPRHPLFLEAELELLESVS